MTFGIQQLDRNSIETARQVLGRGGLVAIPTETVYGLAADANNAQAVAKIFDAKRRPSFNPLISHFAEAQQAFAQVIATPLAQKLAQMFWPGPLTLVLPLASHHQVCGLANNGLGTHAVRVPQVQPDLRDLLAQFPAGLAAPSANPSGRLSPTTAQQVQRGLGGKVDLILDAGPCQVGLESSIVDLSTPQPRLLRLGGIPRVALEDVLGPLRDDLTPERVKAPGQLKSHYAPSKPIRINVSQPSGDPGTWFLDFGEAVASGQQSLNLSPNSDLVEAAANLFAYLAQLDNDPAVKAIEVAPIPDQGLGQAINDRLQRASSD